MKVEASQDIERPVAVVFRFCAQDHVRNHPRWDPDIGLEQLSDGPIGVGTRIRRVNRRSGKPVEGTMEIVKFEPERKMAGLIREGPLEVKGGMVFEALGPDRTRLTLSTEMPADPRWEPTMITRSLERSLRNIKELIEGEL